MSLDLTISTFGTEQNLSKDVRAEQSWHWKVDINISKSFEMAKRFEWTIRRAADLKSPTLIWIFDSYFSGAKDADSKPANLTFTLVSSEDLNTLGYLSLQKDKSVNRFTQQDLELNRIFFTHQGTCHSVEKSKITLTQKLFREINLQWDFN